MPLADCATTQIKIKTKNILRLENSKIIIIKIYILWKLLISLPNTFEKEKAEGWV